MPNTGTSAAGLWEESERAISLWRTPRVRSLLLLSVIGAVVGAIWLGARFYTDLLWFREVGQERVLLTTLKWKIEAKALFPLATTCILLLNFAIADRVLAARASPAPVWPRVAKAWPYRSLIYPLVSIFGGWLVHRLGMGPTWQQLLLWSNRSQFGQTDPLFHRDVGFYVFSLPLHHALVHWLLATLVGAAAATGAVYLAAGGVRVARPHGALRGARAHLLAVAALLLLVTAWRLRLDQFAFALPHRGSVVPGASYTDVHVRLPAVRVLMWLCVAGAAGAAYTSVRRVPSAPLAALATLAALVVVGANALPNLIEQYDVAPQELTREKPYIADAIGATRRAYDLDRVNVVSLPSDGAAKLTTKDIADSGETLDNVSMWDPHVLRSAMDELESIGRYYSFPSTTVDRYTINGVPQLMTLGSRGLDLQGVSGWATTRFAYTHGYGVVAAKASAVDSQHYPQFAEGNFDSKNDPLQLREPRIYYGELQGSSPPFTVVNSSRGEVEQPKPGTEAPDYHYTGDGGIPLSSTLRRVAFAARFSDIKLLLTQTVTKDSRIMYHRGVRDRLVTIAPFLHWDKKPETAVIDGRIKYLFHGYTTSNAYPYAQPVRFGGRHVNYVRAAVQATVDAFDGHVSVYAADGEDPILRAWKAAYPKLFLSADKMPAGLRDHLRYPKPLFSAQVEAYQAYHATNATGFWNGADAWQRPLRLAGSADAVGQIRFPSPGDSSNNNTPPDHWLMQPEYLLARLPGDDRERLMLGMPFTPEGRHNMVGYLAGSLDGLGRPRLTLLSLPRDKLFVGPAQATRRILASSGVNKAVELLNKESRDLGKSAVNRTVLGIPRVIPVGDTLLHVQPIYVTAGGSTLPRLQLVTVQANGRVGYGNDLRSALKMVLPATPAPAATKAPTAAAPSAKAPATAAPAQPSQPAL
ncbi:MAG: uncharacterized protein QOJ12_1420, partial [Thermoleophilales bacterium]|nr:uncharacterized protein [Thermoleophilales bacterium]